MKRFGITLTLLSLLVTTPLYAVPKAVTPALAVDETEVTLSPEEQQYVDQARKIWESLNKQHGKIKLLNGVATLNVPDNFYYLDAKDTSTVLIEVWGNPPESATSNLGMLFPADMSPFTQDSWGVVIRFEEEGYIRDEDADELNYDDMLAQMKADTKAASAERVKQGYEPIELVGWAARPYYDKQSHKLHWAKEIKFGDAPVNTLNYSIRVLGRKGVLVMNFVAGMDQKASIDHSLNSVLSLAEFDTGNRYADFNPEIDKVATYGIGALVAGKVLAKTGFIAAGLIFLKKFGVIILVGTGALIGKLVRRKAA